METKERTVSHRSLM